MFFTRLAFLKSSAVRYFHSLLTLPLRSFFRNIDISNIGQFTLFLKELDSCLKLNFLWFQPSKFLKSCLFLFRKRRSATSTRVKHKLDYEKILV